MTYEYEREDGTRFEIQQSAKDFKKLETCPTTGQKVTLVIQPASFRTPGPGFHSRGRV